MATQQLEREVEIKIGPRICSGCGEEIDNPNTAYKGPSYDNIPPRDYHNKACFDRFTED